MIDTTSKAFTDALAAYLGAEAALREIRQECNAMWQAFKLLEARLLAMEWRGAPTPRRVEQAESTLSLLIGVVEQSANVDTTRRVLDALTRNTARLQPGWSARVPLSVLGIMSGHDITDPLALLDAGVPADIVDAQTEFLRSDGTLCGPEGPVPFVVGVYGYHFARRMAADMQLPLSAALGRGSEYKENVAHIRQHAGPQ